MAYYEDVLRYQYVIIIAENRVFHIEINCHCVRDQLQVGNIVMMTYAIDRTSSPRLSLDHNFNLYWSS